jgi:hypothetical protein
MTPIFIVKVLIVGVIIGGILMYMTGNRTIKSFNAQNLASKRVYNPFSIIKFLIQVILLAIFSFASILFITKFGV